jgi:hypothetical protein
MFLVTTAQNITPEVKLLIIPLYCLGSNNPPATIPTNTLNDLAYSINNCSNGNNYMSPSSQVSSPYPITCTQNDIYTCSEQPIWETLLPINLNKNYKDYYVFMITPQEYITSCPIGLGLVGGNRAWIRYDNVDTSVGFYHELGHLWGLDHANTPNEEYGDLSSAMGYCCTFRCHNSPGADYLGWSRNVINADTQLFTNDIPIIYNTSYHSFDFILIDRNIYVSYRQNIEADSGLEIPWYGHLLIHIMNPNMTTTILGTLSLTDIFEISISINEKLIIQPLKFEKLQAVVQITKSNGTSNTSNTPIPPLFIPTNYYLSNSASQSIDFHRIWLLMLCVIHVLLGL